MDTASLSLNADDLASAGIGENVEAADLTVALGTLKEYINDPEHKDMIARKSGELSFNANYESTPDRVMSCYYNMILTIIVFAGLSVITLEFIDRDKR